MFGAVGGTEIADNRNEGFFFPSGVYNAGKTFRDLRSDPATKGGEGMRWSESWLEGEAVDSAQLEALLNAREKGEADFLLVDVREPWEYEMGHIPGVDLLRPTTAFRRWAKELVAQTQDRPVILTCRTANRTGMLQPLLRRMGHPRIINHTGGIVAWTGPLETGGYEE